MVRKRFFLLICLLASCCLCGGADVQSRIDACAARGGGRVTLGPGVHESGCLTLRSNVELHLAKGAVLKAPPTMAGYPQRKLTLGDAAKVPRWNAACFIFAEGATNVAITGEGTIDANGRGFVVPRPRVSYGWKFERIKGLTPPRVVWLLGCRDVRLEGVEMVNQPAGWSYWISDCDRVLVEGLRIHASVYYPNNDGVHVNSSRDVVVRNCDIECGDDAIVMRANNVSLPVNRVCERMVVSNCVLRSYANGIRIGWINDGVIRNGLFRDIRIRKSTNGIGLVLPPPFTPSDVGREATRFENLTFENIEMDDIYIRPVVCTIDSGEATRFDAFENIVFRNVHARGLKLPSVQAPSFKKPAPFIYENCSFESVPETEIDIGDEAWRRFAHDGAFEVGDYRVKFSLALADGSSVDAAEMTRVRIEPDGDALRVKWTGHPRLGALFTAAADLRRTDGTWRTGALRVSGALPDAPAVREVRWPEVTEPWVDVGRILPAADVSRRPLAIRRSGRELGGVISSGYPSGVRYVAIGNLTAEGRSLEPTADGKIVDLGALFPDGVKKGAEGTRWVDVAFEVTAPAAGRYVFLFHNDYWGRVAVNGGATIPMEGPYDGFAPVTLELKEGVNRIVFGTRSGSGGRWTFGAAVAVMP